MGDSVTDGMLGLREMALAWQPIDEGAVVLDLGTSTYFSVNPSGALLLALLDGGCSRQALVGALTERYAIDPDRAARETDGFLAALRARGLLDEGRPRD